MNIRRLLWPIVCAIAFARGQCFAAVAPGDITFVSPITLPVGRNPVSVVAADFNRDGRMDLACANFYDGTVSILIGDGLGQFNFAPPTVPTLNVGGPIGLWAGDLNGDGNPDLVAPSRWSGKIAIFLGDGHGGFVEIAPVALGSTAYLGRVKLTDLNNDGKFDLIVINGEANAISTFLGDGRGGFAAVAGSPFVIGLDPQDIDCADFNGDGLVDVVGVSQHSVENDYRGVSVLLGLGGGRFSQPISKDLLPLPANWPHGIAWAVSAADINGDGRPDVVAAVDFGGLVFLNNGNGSFRLDPTYSILAENARALDLTDLNNDGAPEIIAPMDTYWRSTGNVMVLPGRSPGVTYSPREFSVGPRPRALAVADVNNDGSPDIIVANWGNSDGASGSITVLLNRENYRSIPRVSFYAPPVLENRPFAVVRIGRNDDLQSAFGFSLRIVPNTALPDVDYVPLDLRVSFAPDETLKEIQIPIFDNDLLAPERSFSVEVYDPDPSVLFANRSAVVRLLDDDFMFSYEVGEHEIKILKYLGNAQTITIPDALDGRAITILGEGAFEGRTAVTEVILPAGLKSIEARAFTATGITRLLLPESIQSIGDWAFDRCAALEDITIPASVSSLGMRLFASCNRLRAINVAPANTNYSSLDGALYDVSRSSLLEVPAGKTGAFAIPEGVTSIRPGALLYCSKLTEISIPATWTLFSENDFLGCASLTNFLVAASNPELSDADGLLYDRAQRVLLQVPRARAGRLVIPEAVSNVWGSAFNYCAALTEVSIPASLATIAPGTFYSSLGITNFEVASSNPVYRGNDGPIYRATSSGLEIHSFPLGKRGSFVVDQNISTIGNVFAGCSLSSLHCGDRIQYLNYGALAGCARLTNITFGSALTGIGKRCFQGCLLLRTVTFPSSLRVLGERAFDNCPSLQTVYFGGDAPSLDPFEEDFYMFTLFSSTPKIFYQPGAQGWESTFVSASATEWNPIAKTSGPNLGVRNGQFNFTITGNVGLSLAVEATSDLAHATWTTLGTVTLANGNAQFSSPLATNSSQLFYRFRMP